MIISILQTKNKFLIKLIQVSDDTAQKMKFSIKDFFSKCDQIRSFSVPLKERL